MDGTPSGVTWSGLWKIFFMILLAWILFVARDVLVAIFFAIVIAAALDRPVSALERKKIPRLLGTLIIYIGAIILIALIIYAVLPAAVTELTTLLLGLRNASDKIAAFVDATGLIQVLNTNLNKIGNILFGGASSLLSLSSKFLGGLIFAGSVFVLSFYLTIGRDGVERFLITILPAAYESKIVALYTKVRRKIGRWLNGQLILSFVVGFTVFLGLWLLGVKYSLVLGIVAGVMELIPYVGPILSGSLAVLIGLTISWKLALYILILFIIVQQLENHILVPAVMSMTTALDPAVIIIALLVGVKVFGFAGLVLAVPAAVLIQELIEDWSDTRARKARLKF